MTTLLQISDTHFGTERPEVVAALHGLTQRLRPDLLVLSGDITQRATSDQFRAARVFIDRLQVPKVIVMPGNHDIPLYNLPLRLFAPYARQRRHFGPDIAPVFESPDLLVIMVKTTRRYRHIDGEVSERQIEDVAHRLERAGALQLRIVVTHQPIAVSRKEDEHDRLHRHAEAMSRWAAAGADLLLSGHIHLPSVQALHLREPRLPRPLWNVQAGTALSSRIRHEADNSVNFIRSIAPVARTAPRQALVERYDFQDGRKEFAIVEQHHMSFDRTPPQGHDGTAG
jgi:3',5'-cyclic AMP phosphodiesterase CpdA